MKDTTKQQSQAFADLRKLLMGPELEKLESLSQRVEVPENFSDKVGEILPQAMLKSASSGEQLSEAMVPTVESILRLSIKRDINKFADALFPVIGPAIRKSISEAMRQLMQTLNRTLEQSFSLQGLKWRVESWRSGVSVAQIAMLHGLVYRVEQVFLIHRNTGLLLHHLIADDVQAQNADLVSSMLAAIRDFVGDSFAIDHGQSLGSIEVGELSIWIEQGPDAILAIAIRGVAPRSLRTTLQETMENLQLEFSEEFKSFKGDTAIFEQSGAILDDCLQAQYQQGERKKSSRALIVLILLAIVFIGWIGFETIQSIKQNEYLESLEKQPGYLVTNVTERDGILVIRGLRDPLAKSPVSLLAESGLKDDKVDHRFDSYQSLEAEFVLKRARAMLGTPDSVTLVLENGILEVGGVASKAWQQSLAPRVPMIAGISAYDDSRLNNHFETAMLNPPDSLNLSFDAGVLYLDGRASQGWIESLNQAVMKYDEILRVDSSGLINSTNEALLAEISKLEREEIYFDQATSYNLDQSDIARISQSALKIIQLGNQLGNKLTITLRGYSDSVGNFEDNVYLSLDRADYVAQALYLKGINPKYIEIKGLEAPVPKEENADERRRNRRVAFEVRIE